MSHLAGASRLSDMSQGGMAGHRSVSPASVNYIRANTQATSLSNPQPRSKLRSAATQAPASKHGQRSKRSQLRSKVKKAFTSVKKCLKKASSFVFAGNNHSNSSLGSVSHHSQTLAALTNRDSTPSICLTKPIYRGSNVRLSLHQAPSTPNIPQTLLFDGSQIPHSGNDRTNRKSTRFQHPVVSGVINDCGVQGELTIPIVGEQSLSPGNTRPETASTIGTIDFDNQVNPIRIFRHSPMVSGTESFERFKNTMDGVKSMMPPRANTEARVTLPATVPSLPYIAVAPAMVMDVGEITSHIMLADQSTEQDVATTASNVPAIPAIPSALTPGSQQPASKPRARPHTTNELLSGASFLPYMPYNPRFNPYNATLASSTPSPTPTSSQKPSAEELAAAFAEAEAAEQAAIRKRHTNLYAAVESGSLTSLTATTTASTATTASAATTASTATVAKSSSSSTASSSAIKRKPVPKRGGAMKSRTSKPLPPLPAPSSPRRFTHGIVPANLQMNENGFPVLGRSAARR